MTEVADKLFEAFERGETAAAASLFSADAHVEQHFAGTKPGPVSARAFLANLSALTDRVGTPKYLDRRVFAFEDGSGFVEQHTSELTGPTGSVVRLAACIVGRTNEVGCRCVALAVVWLPNPNVMLRL